MLVVDSENELTQNPKPLNKKNKIIVRKHSWRVPCIWMVGRFCFGVVSNTSSSAGFHKGVLGPALPHQLTNKVALPPDSPEYEFYRFKWSKWLPYCGCGLGYECWTLKNTHSNKDCRRSRVRVPKSSRIGLFVKLFHRSLNSSMSRYAESVLDNISWTDQSPK